MWQGPPWSPVCINRRASRAPTRPPCWTASGSTPSAAGIFGLHDVIDPADTRDYLIRMLELVTDRRSGGVGKHLLHNWPTAI